MYKRQVLDEMPKNRLPIKNCVVDPSFRKKAYAFLEAQVEAGHQVYVILSLIHIFPQKRRHGRYERQDVPQRGASEMCIRDRSEAGESTATAAAMPPLHYADIQRPQPTQCYVSVLQAEQAFAALRLSLIHI